MTFKYNIGLEIENVFMCIEAETQEQADDKLAEAVRIDYLHDTIADFWVNDVTEDKDCNG